MEKHFSIYVFHNFSNPKHLKSNSQYFHRGVQIISRENRRGDALSRARATPPSTSPPFEVSSCIETRYDVAALWHSPFISPEHRGETDADSAISQTVERTVACIYFKFRGENLVCGRDSSVGRAPD